jgi:hypothetical protein
MEGILTIQFGEVVIYNKEFLTGLWYLIVCLT